MANIKPKCPKCEGTLKQVTRTKTVPVAGVAFDVTWSVWECPRDRQFIVPPDVHQAFDDAALREIATRGPARGRTLKYMRGALQMKASALADLLKVQPETLSRWENEAQPVNPLVWALVAGMALDHLEGRETTAARLRAATCGQPPLEPIAVQVSP